MSVGSVVEAAQRRGVPIARAFQVSNVERYVRRMNAPPEFSKAYHLQAIEQAYKAQKYRIDPFLFKHDVRAMLNSSGGLNPRHLEQLRTMQAELTTARPDRADYFHFEELERYLAAAEPAPAEPAPAPVKKPIGTIRSEVCALANRLTKTMTRKEAFEAAWRMTAAGTVKIPVAGVTFGKRQEALMRLQRYAAKDIYVVPTPEPENPYDKDAIAIKAGVQGGKGLYCIGYVPRTETKRVKALLDTGWKAALHIICAETYSAQISISI